MRSIIESLLRKASWFPGLEFLDDWANRFNAKWGKYQQTKGDYQARFEVRQRALGMSGKKKDKPDAAGAAPAAVSDTANFEETSEQTPENATEVSSPAAQAAAPQEAYPTGRAPGAGRRRSNIPATVAWCTFLFLLITVICVWILFLFDERNVPWRHSMSWLRIVLQVVLVIAIPIVLHRALKYWLEGDVGKYPDIDYAWHQGMSALRRCQIDLSETPVFLVIGTESQELEQSLISASGLHFSASDIPGGSAPLHWSISPQGIFLFASGVGWSSNLAAVEYADRLAAEQMDLQGSIEQPLAGGQRASQGSADTERRLTSTESTQELDRLRYVCQLLRVHRHPLCALNGVLAIISNRFASESNAQTDEREQALASDLSVIQQNTQLSCPITLLITGMEQEAGFRELIRRVGSSRARLQRFGKSFETTLVKSESALHAFGIHVCGTFEDWIYLLFREQDALSRPGNLGLFQLLCNVRCYLKPKLTRLLTHSFVDSSNSEPLLFSGCYFAATGESADRQGFVKAVFDKLIQEQELLQWTPAAIKQDRRVRWIGLIGNTLFVAGIIWFVSMVGLQWFA